MSRPALREYADADALARAVADSVAALIDEALRTNGQALFVFPGGRSPAAVFERLVAIVPDWRRITILPGDERLVPADDPLSNVATLYRHFAAAGARVLPLVESPRDRHAAAAEADARLGISDWRPDLVWLGMGADGHTASIFPGPDYASALSADTRRRVVGVLPDPLPPEAPVARVSLTLGAIVAARRLILTLAGTDKRRVLEQALDEGAASRFPIGRVLAAAPMRTDIHWNPA